MTDTQPRPKHAEVPRRRLRGFVALCPMVPRVAGRPKGRLPRKRRLVDMATRPEEFCYQPPPREDCDPDHWVFPISEDQRLEVQSWVFRGKVVDFAIMQVLADKGEDVHIARIDCCHGRVHRHVFAANGDDLVEGQVIQVISDRNSAEMVDREFGLALDKMQGEWRENARQWGRM